MRAISISLLCTIGMFGVSSQPAPAQNLNGIQASGNKLQVYVTASSKHGFSLVLTSQDISLSVNKKPARVFDVRPAKGDPLLFALLVDISESDGQEAKLIRELAKQLFQALAINTNQGYLVLFNDKILISQTPMSPQHVEADLATVKFERSTSLYDAIQQTCTSKLGSAQNPNTPRRVIVIVSDGEDSSSHVSHTQAEETAQKQGVTIFPVLIPSTYTGPASRGAERMSDFSRTTGGRLVKANNVEDAVKSLVSALDEQWVVTFAPAQAGDGRMHSFQAKSAAKDLKLSSPSQVLLP